MRATMRVRSPNSCRRRDSQSTFASTPPARRCSRASRRTASASRAEIFYFAGHGLQLAWRNYMLPVNAAVQAAEDIPAQGVDLGAVLDGIKRAANAMNLVIV